MERKKIIGSVLIVLSLFSVLIGLGLQRDLEKLDKRKNTISNQYENIKEEMNIQEDKDVRSELSIKKKMAAKVISQFMYYINTKNFDKAYNMLDKKYVKDFAIELKQFEDMYNFDTEKIVKYESFTFDHKNKGIIKTFLMEKESQKFIKKTFTIYPSEDGTYRLADIGIKNNKKLGIENSQNSYFRVESLEEYETTEGFAYIVGITNISDETIYISLDSWTFYNIKANNQKNNYTPLTNNSLENMIIPKDKKIYRLLFKQDSGIKNLYITLEGGEEIEVILSTSSK